MITLKVYCPLESDISDVKKEFVKICESVGFSTSTRIIVIPSVNHGVIGSETYFVEVSYHHVKTMEKLCSALVRSETPMEISISKIYDYILGNGQKLYE